MTDSIPPISESYDDDDDDAPHSAFEAARGAKRLLVVGGGRGGVGKSLVSQNLAIYFAQLGKAVLLVDADPTGANLHSQFGLEAGAQEPPIETTAQAQFEERLLPTNVPGLRILPFAHDAIDPPVALRAGRKARWLTRLRSVAADYVVVNTGPGHTHLALDLMLSADVAIAVTMPEPPAIEATYRFLRAAFKRRLRRTVAKDRFRAGLVERAMREIGRLPAPLELVRSLARMDRNLAELAWSEACRLRMQLVVNQTRARNDLELGAWMSGLSLRHYGIQLDELGHIEQDDTVWLCVRRQRPLLIDSPTSKAARNLERIARRVAALGAVRSERATIPPAIPMDRPDLYSLLGVTRSANDEEIRRAYKRQREVYATAGLATCSLLSEAELKAEQARLEEAHDTLLDPIRRRAYDLSTFQADIGEARPSQVPRPALAAEQLMLQSELLRELGPDTEFTGALLRKVRESQGVDLVEISIRTKIAKAHLEALEDEAFTQLPAAVYVRGFVTELAKYLRLDPTQVQRTYLRRMRDKGEEG